MSEETQKPDTSTETTYNSEQQEGDRSPKTVGHDPGASKPEPPEKTPKPDSESSEPSKQTPPDISVNDETGDDDRGTKTVGR